MDPQSQASWMSTIPVIVLLTGLILLPGWTVAKSFGTRSMAALGMAPAVGTCVLLLAAAAAAALGVGWSPAVGLPLVVFVALLLAGVGRVVRARTSDSTDDTKSHWIALAASVVFAAAVTSWQLVSGTGRPDALAQMPDAPFHLVAVLDLVDAQSASPFVSGRALWYLPEYFYPGGFHSVAATAALWTGVQVDVACHATLLVFTAVFWPLSLIVLVRAAVQGSASVILATGVLVVATSFSALAVMPIGAVWANAASSSLLPALLIPVVGLARSATVPTPRTLASTACLLLLMTAAAALCQPNVVFGLALIGLLLLGPAAFGWGKPWAATWVAALVGTAAVWILLFPASVLDIPVNGDPNLRRAVLLVLKGGDVPLLAGAVLAVLTLVGVISSLARRSTAGQALAYGACFLLLFSVVFDTGLEVQRLAWPWYSGVARISAVFAIPAIICAAQGFAVMERILRARTASAASTLVALGVVLLGVVAVPAVGQVRESVHLGYYPNDPAFAYVTGAEVGALEDLAREIPSDGATALDPFRGGMYLSMFGRRTLPMVPFSAVPPEAELIDRSLDSASSDTAVCQAVRDLGITHVLTGGSRARFWSALDPQSPGVDAVPGAAGFAKVAEAGPYVLYEVPTKCRA